MRTGLCRHFTSVAAACGAAGISLAATLACADKPVERAAETTDAPHSTLNYAGPGGAQQLQSTDGSSYAAMMAGLLSDPVQRAQIRARWRAEIVERHPDLIRVLELDESAAEMLFDLLTDLQMERLDRCYNSAPGLLPVEGRTADEVAVRGEARISSWLGRSVLERYRAYREALDERRIVMQLGQQLDERDALTFEQKEKLVSLLAEVRATRMGAAVRSNASELRIRALQRGVPLGPDDSREMELQLRRLLARAAELLTEPQLAALEQIETQKLDWQRQRLYYMTGSAEAGASEGEDRTGETDFGRAGRRGLGCRES
jgi:hypothetical protein